MTTDDALLSGLQFTRDHIAVIETTCGPKVAMAYAAGMACGARNQVAEKNGARAAFELMTVLADDVLTICLKNETGGSKL